MAGDVVSASTGAMNSLLGKLATLMGEEYVKLKDVRKEIASLEDEFTSMKALLDKLSDMDELDPQAKEWKNQIKDMSYDIEDCIDDFIHHIGKNHGNTGFVNKAARQLKKLRARHQIASKIQEIKVRVKEAGERRTRYKLDEYTPNPSYVPVDPRVVAIHTEAASLVGMDIPREELVEMVTGEEQVLKVVSVVGFGGLGKTTLANQVYRKLEGQFECKAFVSVSQKPDMPRLLNKILLEVGGNVSHTTAELDDLENIKKHLRDKRYFVVIDDLWDSSAWKIIKCAFPENNRGSRILTTTRMSEVALACCSYSRKYVYHMRPLGEDNSKGLFFSRIFGSSQACPDFAFEDSSADILKKCGGLPLAIISIASLLAGQSSSKWEYVRNSLGSMFEGNPNLEDMMRILDLSYRNLPRHLKTCLLYIGLYPEDHIIKKDDLVRQWIAEGFVSKVRGLHAEDVAGSYFNELINTSMIQPVKTDYNDEVLSCRVHDIMLDLIRLKSEEENFIHVIDDSESSSLHKKPHRVSLHHLIAASGQIPAMVVNGPVRQVRSFVAFTEVCIMPSLEGFKYVRVLQLKFRPSRTFGNSEKVKLAGIGRLFLLKYLKIESRNVELELPNQIRDLRCLETMDIRLARSIVMPKVTIPSDICRLHRLSHLIVVPRGTFEGGIGSLRSLRTLKRFDIRSSSLDSVKSLGELTNLRDLKLCCDSYLEEDNNNNMMVLDALKTTLERLAHSSSCLRSLSVSLSARLSPARSDWFNTLSPFPRNLRRLHVVHTLPRIPRWIAQLHDLYSLELRVEEVVEMSSTEEDDDDDIGILAGLPSLAHLQLQIESVCPRERIAIPNNTGMAFPALKHLTLTGPKPFLAFKSGALPRLQELELVLTEVEWKDFGEWLDPVGMEHLPPGLKKTLIRCFDPEFDGCPLFPGEATQSALRSRFSAHHPGVDLSFYRS